MIVMVHNKVELRLLKTFYRRVYWLSILMFSVLGCQPRANTSISTVPTPHVYVNILGQREYDVHQQLTLVNKGPGQPEKQNIWVALIQTFSPYQKVQSMQVSPQAYTIITDEYGNHYAEFDFSGQPAGTTKTVQIDYRVTVNELSYNLTDCRGALLTDFTQPELHRIHRFANCAKSSTQHSSSLFRRITIFR